MQELNRKTVLNQLCLKRIIQFGEGNFLRAFVDWFVMKTLVLKFKPVY
ncbi:hypothetical protein FACS1894179_10990 [Bacteroidia bacterium]|nr:hypothetical protein FACS1894179_10990 [Bacteroidia bacterium]